MKEMAFAALITIVVGLLLQPFFEMGNMMKEKVALDSALLNSCRAARVNALSGRSMGDLEARIDTAELVHYFSEAFCDTFGLTRLSPADSDIMPDDTEVVLTFTSADGRFNTVTVWLAVKNDLTYSDIGDEYDDYFGVTDEHNRTVTVVESRLETHYRFRTSILTAVNDALSNSEKYLIASETKFLIQMIN